jgi:ABC-2 type transport system ATP-binding protein
MLHEESPLILEGRDLVKRYGAVTAVHDIGFSIRTGQILGVLGPNGAGKSTIVKMVTGLLEPTRGAVLFRGDRIGDHLSEFKRCMGYVPEQPDLYGMRAKPASWRRASRLKTYTLQRWSGSISEPHFALPRTPH